MAENNEEKKEYPVSRKNQVLLFRECMEDASILTGSGIESIHGLPIAHALFSYRIQIVSDLAKIYGEEEDQS